MSNIKVKRILLLLVLLLTVVLHSCIAWDPVFRYDGKHVDCAATVIYSIPGIESLSMDELLILDTDSYGRVMFAYKATGSALLVEHSDAGYNGYFLFVVIMQASDSENVYFLPEQNYIGKTLIDDGNITNKSILTKEYVASLFSENELLSLQSTNEWEQPLKSLDMYTCAPMELEKQDDHYPPKKQRQLSEYIANPPLKYWLFRRDCEGKYSYFIHVINDYEEDDKTEYTWYLVVLDKDQNLYNGSTSVIKLDQSKDLTDQVKAFLAQNNWVN
ncbi:MAG: hypothetical protein IJF08_03750 [Clostridia bacterium]|nr:hypothetical protein [Clostridia bacterium]